MSHLCKDPDECVRCQQAIDRREFPDDGCEDRVDSAGRTADWNWPRGYGGELSSPW